jgi:hypothetical protein
MPTNDQVETATILHRPQAILSAKFLWGQDCTICALRYMQRIVNLKYECLQRALQASGSWYQNSTRVAHTKNLYGTSRSTQSKFS